MPSRSYDTPRTVSHLSIPRSPAPSPRSLFASAHSRRRLPRARRAFAVSGRPDAPGLVDDDFSRAGKGRVSVPVLALAASERVQAGPGVNPSEGKRGRVDGMTPSGPAPRAFAIRRDAPPAAAEVGGQARQPLRRPPDESGPPVLPVCEPTLQSPRLTYRHPYHRSSELQTSHKDAERFLGSPVGGASTRLPATMDQARDCLAAATGSTRQP